tara:strand:+ start:116 stop:619 length:504 start_codon:yes stop_codon:yes gene_type:complete
MTNSALRKKKYIETIVIDKIKFKGKKENFKKENSNQMMLEERELNVDKKEFLNQDEIKKLKVLLRSINIERLKEIIKNIDHVYPEALRKSGLMEWCVKTCRTYEITLDDFRSKKRLRNLVQARTDFCHAVIKNTNFNYNTIANFMNKDHTTVLHHIKKLKPKHFVNE